MMQRLASQPKKQVVEHLNPKPEAELRNQPVMRVAMPQCTNGIVYHAASAASGSKHSIGLSRATQPIMLAGLTFVMPVYHIAKRNFPNAQ